MRIWTVVSDPFTDARKDHRRIATEVAIDDSDWVLLGKGYRGAKIANGCYVDKTSGALIGTDLDMIKRDIKATTKKVIDEQLKNMKAAGKNATLVSNEEFFSMTFRD